ncbi:hypothetical protein AGMMS49579_12250 [Spirochaetia bacterium]|nr:hypothetical protein AGMMS49579_12250 [Spirochaetia bacterium]
MIIKSIDMVTPVVFTLYKKGYDDSMLEIVDAARIDGSGEFGTFNRIILPIRYISLRIWKNLLKIPLFS